MNKYQEALDSLRKECKATFVNEKGIRMYSSNKNDDERCNTIQQFIDKLPHWLELEDKAIPKKVIWGSDDEVLCPSCSEPIDDDYALVSDCCYQRLDWSVEE